jgi:hypothetical protein
MTGLSFDTACARGLEFCGATTYIYSVACSVSYVGISWNTFSIANWIEFVTITILYRDSNAEALCSRWVCRICEKV